MQAAVTAKQIGDGIVLFILWVVFIGVHVGLCWLLLYRWCIKFTPYSKRTTAVLCFFPLFNVLVTFPLMAGWEVGWTTSKRVRMILCMTLLGGWGWLWVISSWRGDKKIQAQYENHNKAAAK
jgi:hypothetical protein